ncbi:pseudouridine synthase [Trichocladium antarcticum]|uniref:Pseudouridine synthase n=1 Tax=Trichocladium antarcticum TaxID=1450529 RepID=A0AAN6UHM9_9PEZI|nr:pseudouridine synthase [Trichocladium antarcticum]
MADPTYADWSKDRLVERVRELEMAVKQQQQQQQQGAGAKQKQAAVKPPSQAPANAAATPPEKKQRKKGGKMDPSKYSTRLVALKLAYLGKRYGGFEYSASSAVPSIEEELWKALVKGCLILPENPDKVAFEPWEYSKCGRTDRGVSAFGQVIGIRLRSNRPVAPEAAGTEGDGKPAWDPVADEINYPRILNRLLPPDIRVLAWAPTLPPNFSARFSCWERQYRYFFTQPAYAPLPGSLDPSGGPGKEGWLDLDAMRAAAKMYEGVHDFRNFCKIDGGKQITNFNRRVFEADIVEVDDMGSALPYLSQHDFRPAGVAATDAVYPKVYYFHVRGSAFLWHQIRHMVGVLFTIGQGLEKPSLVADLLDAGKHPRRPNYTMADDVPLVLWDCVFPKADEDLSRKKALEVHDPDAEGGPKLEDAMDWVWLGEDEPSFQHGPNGLVDQLWETWRERKMDELLANQLLNAVAGKADLSRKLAELGPSGKPNSHRAYEGGNSAKAVGKYVPVLKRSLLASPQDVNEKWAQSKGFASAAELSQTKNWRSVIKARRAGEVDTSNNNNNNNSSVDE